MTKMMSLKTVTEMNTRLMDAGKNGPRPRLGKTERDHKSGAHARNRMNVAARGDWENACGGNQKDVPHPDNGKARGKRNPHPAFKAPRKGGPRKRN